MHYIRTIEATGWTSEQLDNWKTRLLYKLFFFIPRANPDNEPLYPLVKEWLLEIDDSGKSVREVALGENDAPIFCAPNERNWGLWTDSHDQLEPQAWPAVDKSYFEDMWARASAGT